MKPLKMDMSKFKKIGGDRHSTTFQHEGGHQIKIVHSALPKEQQEAFKALPMSKGGTAQQNYEAVQRGANTVVAKPSPSSGDTSGGPVDVPAAEASGSAKTYSDAIKSGKTVPDESPAPKAEDMPLGYAKGGNVCPMCSGGNVPHYADGTPDGGVPDSNDSSRPAVNINVGGGAASPTIPDQFVNPAPGAQSAAEKQDISGISPVKPPLDPTGSMSDQQIADALAQAEKAKAQLAEPKNAPAPDVSAPPVNVSPTPPPQGENDPYGTNATTNNYMAGFDKTMAGIQGQANATGAEGQAQAKILQQAQNNQQQTQQNYQDHFAALDKERQAFQQDLENQHIDPQHYWNDKSTAGKVATGIGLILGGIGGGLTHQENPALKFLQSNIDRDIQSQQANLGKSESLLSANMKQFGNLRDATDMTRIMQMDITSNQLKQAAAQAATPQAKAAALQAAGQLQMQAAPLMGQMAMRRTLLSGMQNGQVSPDKIVNFLIPEPQRAAANKELSTAQNDVSNKNLMMNAFDAVNKEATAGNLLNPQSYKRSNSTWDSTLDKFVKDNEGRVTPETVKLMSGLRPVTTDDAQTVASKRAQLNQILSQHMHYPLLSSYGINQFEGGGATIKKNPPVLPQSK